MPIFFNAISLLYGLSSFTTSLIPYLLYDLETISVICRSNFFRSSISFSISSLSDYM